MKKNVLLLNYHYTTQFLDINNQYASIFDKDKFHVTSVYLKGEPDDDIKKRTQADEVIFLNFSRKHIRGLKIAPIKALLKLCREKNVSIVVCQRYKLTYILMCVAQFYKIPAVFFVMHALNTINTLPRKIMTSLLARNNMRFAGVSDAVRNDMRNNMWRIPKDHIITLYNSIDVDHTKSLFVSRQEARAFLGLPQDAWVFGSIARLAPEKDQATLLKAFAKIAPLLPKARLIIIGDGQLENQVKQHIEALHLSDRVMLTGFVPGAYRYVKAFDTFILNSIKEGFGRVLIEAMLAKIPMIGTQAGGIPEVIGDTGIIVPPKQPDLLANAMLTMSQQSAEALANYGELGYQRVINTFSLESFRQRFFDIPLVELAVNAS